VAQYRIVYITDVGDIETPPEIIDCQDDKAAMEIAMLQLNGRLAEVWEGDRLVIRLAPLNGYSRGPERPTRDRRNLACIPPRKPANGPSRFG
jgi:hypothetical protein